MAGLSCECVSFSYRSSTLTPRGLRIHSLACRRLLTERSAGRDDHQTSSCNFFHYDRRTEGATSKLPGSWWEEECSFFIFFVFKNFLGKLLPWCWFWIHAKGPGPPCQQLTWLTHPVERDFVLCACNPLSRPGDKPGAKKSFEMIDAAVFFIFYCGYREISILCWSTVYCMSP